MGKKYNFEGHTKGDTYISPILELIINGTVVDLANYTIKMQVRRFAAKTSPVVIEFSTDNGTFEIVGASTDGKFKIKEEVVDVPAMVYKYDIKFTNNITGKTRRWIKGNFPVIEEVTQ